MTDKNSEEEVMIGFYPSPLDLIDKPERECSTLNVGRACGSINRVRCANVTAPISALDDLMDCSRKIFEQSSEEGTPYDTFHVCLNKERFAGMIETLGKRFDELAVNLGLKPHGFSDVLECAMYTARK